MAFACGFAALMKSGTNGHLVPHTKEWINMGTARMGIIDCY